MSTPRSPLFMALGTDLLVDLLVVLLVGVVGALVVDVLLGVVPVVVLVGRVVLVGVVLGVEIGVLGLLLRFINGTSTSLLTSGGALCAGVVGVVLLLFLLKKWKGRAGLGWVLLGLGSWA